MKLETQSKKTLQNISNNELLMFIDIIKKRYERDFWDTYEKLAYRLKGDFELEITEEDLYYHFAPDVLELDAELNWRLNT